MNSKPILAPDRWSDEGWPSFRNEIAQRMLHLFGENGIELQKTVPVDEDQWRRLAVSLALKHGDLKIELDGVPVGSINSFDDVYNNSAVRGHPDYSSILDERNLKGELVRYFLNSLKEELARGAKWNWVEQRKWKLFLRYKTLLLKYHAYGLVVYKLSSKFPVESQMDRLATARKLLRYDRDFTPTKKRSGKVEASRLAAAELSLWFPDKNLNHSEIVQLGTSISTNDNNISDKEPVENPGTRYLFRLQRVFDTLERVSFNLCLPSLLDPKTNC